MYAGLCCPNAYNVEMGKYTICKRPFHIGHVQVHRKKYSRIERLPNSTKSNERVNVFIMLFEMKCLSILESLVTCDMIMELLDILFQLVITSDVVTYYIR